MRCRVSKVGAYKTERNTPGRLPHTRTPTLPRDPRNYLTSASKAAGIELPEEVAMRGTDIEGEFRQQTIYESTRPLRTVYAKYNFANLL